MPTVQQLLTDVKTRLPYSTSVFTDGTVIGWMNDAQNEVWRHLASTELYEFDTIASQAIYTMASDMRIDMIKSLQVSDSTTIDGTEGYTTYKFAGMDDELTGSYYYDSLGSLGIYPVPSTAGSGYNVKVWYEPSPVQLSTGTLTTVPSINTEYQDILKFRAMKVIAQSGNNPDVELANNYQREEDAIMRVIKGDYYKRKHRKPRETYPRSQHDWQG